MAILAGIDEAGFGPKLGPLVVSGVAFRVPDERVGQCLWKTLRATCTAKAGKAERRLQITDSKQLYRPPRGLAPLERAALVMLAVGDHSPKSWRSLLHTIAPGAVACLDQYAWYKGADVELPISDGVGDVGTRANAIRRDADEHDVTMSGVFSEPLPEGHFNRLVSNTRNKSVVLLGLVLRVMDRIMRSAPHERIRFLVDRLGGRTHYRDALLTAMPEYELEIREESQRCSVYRLTRSSRICEIAFVTDGDDRHFPVALASVYSKYVRELYMHVFNRYWSHQIAGLRPTAGYFTDAQRWLRDVGSELDQRSVDRNMLVRQR